MDAPDTRPYDPLLLTVVVALAGLGVVMVYSSSVVSAGLNLGDGEHYLVRQVVHAGLGLGLLVAGMCLPVRLYRRWAPWMLRGALLLLILLVIPGVGITAGRATRWLGVGSFRFQPSELAKAALVVYLAYSFVKKGEARMRLFRTGMLSHLLVLGLMVALCMKQPDFGASVTMAMLVLGMLYVGGARLKYLLGVAFVTAPLVVIAVMSSVRRQLRIEAWMDPYAHADTSGYHLVQSLRALGSGGLFGLGLGNSRQKLFFLPEAHTDFILAVIGEELGLLAIVAVVGAFGLLCWRGVRAALEAPDRFSRLLAFGITLSLTLQAAINMGVVTGVLPTKGLTLPFVSYGGSSLVVSCWMAGVLLRISTRVPDGADEPEQAPAASRPPRASPGRSHPSLRVAPGPAP